jgi:hypothetical protein
MSLSRRLCGFIAKFVITSSYFGTQKAAGMQVQRQLICAGAKPSAEHIGLGGSSREYFLPENSKCRSTSFGRFASPYLPLEQSLPQDRGWEVGGTLRGVGDLPTRKIE